MGLSPSASHSSLASFPAEVVTTASEEEKSLLLRIRGGAETFGTRHDKKKIKVWGKVRLVRPRTRRHLA